MSVQRAITDIATGGAVVVIDDADRENEADIVFAARAATPELLAFTIRWTSGVICAPLTGADCDRLDLPPMYHANQDRKGTAFTVSVDARDGITTGISAAERAHTLRLLADPGTGPGELARPGHVFPLRAHPDGVLGRRGHTEAAVDLVRLAGAGTAGVVSELVNDDGTMCRGDDAAAFARRHGLTLISVADLVGYRSEREIDLRPADRTPAPAVERVAEARVPTRYGVFTAVGYRAADGRDHVALVIGDLGAGDDVLVRLHSECLTGDVLGSLRCDCGPQLDASLAAVAKEGRGVVVYVRGHEGRGIGLLPKLRAYQLQDSGQDTVDANLAQGLPADARDYGVGARILTDLGVRGLRLLSNNPAKRAGLERYGLAVVGRVALPPVANPENLRYLRTKRDRMGHDLDLPGMGEPRLPEVLA